jgi:diguanylate cyclase (GGDEF)-like protein
LNGLKVNNDYIGHERGDFLLRSLSNNLKVVMSHYSHKEVARIGGDEFLVIVPSCDLSVLEKIKDDILIHCAHENLIDRISVSIGLSFDSTGKYDIYELIQKADQAMYQMKSQTSSAYSKEIVAYAKKLDQFIR